MKVGLDALQTYIFFEIVLCNEFIAAAQARVGCVQKTVSVSVVASLGQLNKNYKIAWHNSEKVGTKVILARK